MTLTTTSTSGLLETSFDSSDDLDDDDEEGDDISNDEIISQRRQDSGLGLETSDIIDVDDDIMVDAATEANNDDQELIQELQQEIRFEPFDLDIINPDSNCQESYKSYHLEYVQVAGVISHLCRNKKY